MAIQISPNLPANVVEIGNEITQAKINEINAGTLALQTWVSASYLTTATASSTYAPKASPTFTGTVTIPAGASISGYLTTSSASATYQTISGMSSYLTSASASSIYQTQAGMSSYLTDAPSNGSEYVRKNGAWAVATGGGGGGSVAWGGITGTVTDQTDLTSYVTSQVTGQGYITDAPAGSDYIRNNNAWALLSDRGFQTATDVSTYVTGLGYQTATDVSTYVTGLGYLTSTAKNVNTQTNTYTLVAADANNIVYTPSGSGGGMSMNIVVPDDTTYNFDIGTIITLCYDTSGGYTIDFSTTSAGSPSLVGNIGTISTGNWGQRTLTKLAANLWLIL